MRDTLSLQRVLDTTLADAHEVTLPPGQVGDALAELQGLRGEQVAIKVMRASESGAC